MSVVTYRYRVKNLNGLLNAQARAVNFVWNFCNDTQKHALRWNKKWPSAYDLMKLTTGSSKELGVAANSINTVCALYDRSRRAKKKPFLRYRGKRSLGWVPFRASQVRLLDDGFLIFGAKFRVFKSRPIPACKIVDGGSFSQDARGNWFVNVAVEILDTPLRDLKTGVGIDLGLKDFAALSTGEKIEAPKHFRSLEKKLSTSHRARKGRQARNICARIAARRKDFLHKLSHRITRDFDYIAVGNVNAAGLSKTHLGKSVGDASWTTFRNFLRYKAIGRGAWYEEVSERFTSLTCSACGAVDQQRPKGIAGLGIRHWVCDECGASHDRDVNAAINILARHGFVTLVEGATNE